MFTIIPIMNNLVTAPIVYPSGVGGFTAIYRDLGVYVELSWNAASISSGSIQYYVIDKRVVGDYQWDNVAIEIGLSYNDDLLSNSPTNYEYRIAAVSDLGVQSQLYAIATVSTLGNERPQQ